MSSVFLQGDECHTNGEPPEAGQQAPDFSLTSTQLKEKKLTDFSGFSKLIYTVPSLDTMVCADTTKQLNELASEQENLKVIVISADLPFAQQRFCKQNKLKNITPLSMMQDKQFAKDYGILLTDGPLAGLCARAVFILDSTNKILHTELVNDIAHSPDFKFALESL